MEQRQRLIAEVPTLNTIFTDPSKLLTCPHMESRRRLVL
jgi:hypothetical protein